MNAQHVWNAGGTGRKKFFFLILTKNTYFHRTCAHDRLLFWHAGFSSAYMESGRIFMNEFENRYTTWSYQGRFGMDILYGHGHRRGRGHGLVQNLGLRGGFFFKPKLHLSFFFFFSGLFLFSVFFFKKKIQDLIVTRPSCCRYIFTCRDCQF